MSARSRAILSLAIMGSWGCVDPPSPPVMDAGLDMMVVEDLPDTALDMERDAGRIDMMDLGLDMSTEDMGASLQEAIDPVPEFCAAEDRVICQVSAGGDMGGGRMVQGAGTESDPYVICEPEEMQLLVDNPEAHFKLGQDIDMSEVDPLRVHFRGMFDGQGYALRNLHIDSTAPYTSPANDGATRCIYNEAGASDFGAPMGGFIQTLGGGAAICRVVVDKPAFSNIPSILKDGTGRECYPSTGGLFGSSQGTREAKVRLHDITVRGLDASVGWRFAALAVNMIHTHVSKLRIIRDGEGTSSITSKNSQIAAIAVYMKQSVLEDFVLDVDITVDSSSPGTAPFSGDWASVYSAHAIGIGRMERSVLDGFLVRGSLIQSMDASEVINGQVGGLVGDISPNPTVNDPEESHEIPSFIRHGLIQVDISSNARQSGLLVGTLNTAQNQLFVEDVSVGQIAASSPGGVVARATGEKNVGALFGAIVKAQEPSTDKGEVFLRVRDVYLLSTLEGARRTGCLYAEAFLSADMMSVSANIESVHTLYLTRDPRAAGSSAKMLTCSDTEAFTDVMSPTLSEMGWELVDDVYMPSRVADLWTMSWQ